MKIAGSHTLHAPAEQVWTALNDPRVLVRTIPGCRELLTTGADSYRVTVEAGVAAVRGTYVGDVRLADKRPPDAYTLVASGAGNPGTVEARCQVRLADLGDGSSRVDYDADATVGGVVAGVGQRVLTGVARKMAGDFFTAVDDVLLDRVPGAAAAQLTNAVAAGAGPLGGAGPAGVGTAAGAGSAGGAGAVGGGDVATGAAGGGIGQVASAPAVGTRFVAPPRPPGGGAELVQAALLGAAVALAGVLVGAAIGRRSRPGRR